MTLATHKDEAVYVVGLGLRTPVGCTVRAVSAAARAGLSAYALHPSATDVHGDAPGVARARWLAPDLPLGDRIADLAAEAAQDAFQPLAAHLHVAASVPVFLALSEENAAAPADRKNIAARVTAALGLAPAGGRSRVAISEILEGHAGGLLALERAVREVSLGHALFCLAGGADSYLSPERLAALSRAGRLHGGGQRWGFTPGEGAGFWAVASGAAVRAFGLVPSCEVVAVATAREDKLLGTRTVCIGEGLTAAFRGALEGASRSGERVATCHGDLNGEPYRADELGFTLCRTAEHFEEPRRVRAPAEHWGDVGAASAPLASALAIDGLTRRPAAAPAKRPAPASALVFSSSADRPLRAAALFRRAPATPPERGA